MDITSFVHSNRDRAFLVGDYATYRRQLSRQLLNLRRKLSRTTPKNQKFAPKPAITAQDVGTNPDFVKLQLLTAERAWAHAMAMKNAHNEEAADEGITGSARSHVLSRLHKASRYADDLVAILKDKTISKATDADLLEAQAYARVSLGTVEFEKHFPHRYDDPAAQRQAWSSCLANFSEAHVVYTALLKATKKELFKEVITGSVDPTIRYAAYQSRISRTIPVPTVAKQHFRTSQKDLHALVIALDPSAFADEKQESQKPGADPVLVDIPTTITWRNRTVPIADAAIGQALATTNTAAQQLSETVSIALRDPKPSTPTLLSAAYDPVLTAAADTVDAVKRALNDLSKEGVSESDGRMQDLRVADLAANYALISWRVGRNRVLISSPPAPKSAGADSAPYAFDDGLHFAALPPAPPKRRYGKKDKAPQPAPKKATESTPHQLARLSTRHALLTATLQSLDTLAQLPGAARDPAFSATLAASRSYFSALRTLAVAASHKLRRGEREALALYAAAASRIASVDSADLDAESESGLMPRLGVEPAQLAALQARTALLTERQRGLVALHMHVPPLGTPVKSAPTASPLVEDLHTCPVGAKADLGHLVEYPPRLRGVPIKPIFLDLAFNYIQYPGRGVEVGVAQGSAKGENGGVPDQRQQQQQQQQQKRGWFGFGRK